MGAWRLSLAAKILKERAYAAWQPLGFNRRTKEESASGINFFTMKKYFFSALCAAGLLALGSCNPEWMRATRQVQDPQQEPEIQQGEASQTVTLAAGQHYARSRTHRFLWGDQYREAWTTPVELPVFNLQAGGYTILKQGGGRQSHNLRVKDDQDNQYVLRSIDKDPAANLPRFLRTTGLGAMVKDQNSSAHPYAALTLPPMAEAIGVYHTNPRLYYIPYDDALGEYRDAFAGMMVIMEHRPDNDQTEFDYLGNAENVRKTGNMLEDRLKKNTVTIDRYHYLRSRLFDMLLGDWSRHEDNWRWAVYEEEDAPTRYQAVPRDRDHVYYRLGGAIPRSLRAAGVKKHFRSFKPRFDNIVELNRSGRPLDELLLAELSREEWQAVADSVKRELTDAAIAQGVRQLPAEVYALNGAWIENSLKARRDALPEEVMKYYASLARKPLVYGTDKHEKFVVRARGEDLEIEMWQASSKGKEKELLFSRLFRASETREITLLGLAGNDRFVFEGEGRSPIRVVIHGGADADHYQQKTKGKAPAPIRIYDTPAGNEFKTGKGVKVTKQKKPELKNFDANGRLLEFYIWD
jgi:hypothetical protein